LNIGGLYGTTQGAAEAAREIIDVEEYINGNADAPSNTTFANISVPIPEPLSPVKLERPDIGTSRPTVRPSIYTTFGGSSVNADSGSMNSFANDPQALLARAGNQLSVLLQARQTLGKGGFLDRLGNADTSLVSQQTKNSVRNLATNRIDGNQATPMQAVQLGQSSQLPINATSFDFMSTSNGATPMQLSTYNVGTRGGLSTSLGGAEPQRTGYRAPDDDMEAPSRGNRRERSLTAQQRTDYNATKRWLEGSSEDNLVGVKRKRNSRSMIEIAQRGDKGSAGTRKAIEDYLRRQQSKYMKV
jgi:hypothetical protein